MTIFTSKIYTKHWSVSKQGWRMQLLVWKKCLYCKQKKKPIRYWSRCWRMLLMMFSTPKVSILRHVATVDRFPRASRDTWTRACSSRDNVSFPLGPNTHAQSYCRLNTDIVLCWRGDRENVQLIGWTLEMHHHSRWTLEVHHFIVKDWSRVEWRVSDERGWR